MILNRMTSGWFLLIASTFLREIENKANNSEWGEGRGLRSAGDLGKVEKSMNLLFKVNSCIEHPMRQNKQKRPAVHI